MADTDVSAAAGKPLSGGNPAIEANDLPPSLVEVSKTASAALLSSVDYYKLAKDLTSTVIVSGTMILLIVFMLNMFREDRTIHRDDMRQMHEDSNRKWEALKESVGAIRENQAVLVGLSSLVREGHETNKALATAVKDLAVEVKKNSTDIRRRIPAKDVDLDGLEHGNKPAAVPAKKAG